MQAAVVWNWVEQDDYPTLTELQEIAPDFFLKEEWDRLRTEMQAELTIGKDKLGGWLVGPQGPRRPRCRECGARMQHIFQIASREHLGYNFGDCGTAHLFYCAVHPRVLGFSWEGC